VSTTLDAGWCLASQGHAAGPWGCPPGV
jgi:hypothetical protein